MTNTPSTKKVSFRVAARSSKPNSLGLYGHVLISKTGLAFEVGRTVGSGNDDWSAGTDLSIAATLNESGEIIGFTFPNCEIPRQLPAAPLKVVRELFKKA